MQRVFRYLHGEMTAVEVYNFVTNGGANDFVEVATILDRHGPWCLIGGLAVNCYVEPVYTVDVDVIVIAENLGAIQDELVAPGFSISVRQASGAPTSASAA